MISPADHPNASAATIVGFVASGIVYAANRLGISLTAEDATYGATVLIALVLFVGKRVKTPLEGVQPGNIPAE